MSREVRKPPVRARLALHKQGIRGWCGWCGTAVEDKTPGRGWLKWWHDACAEEMAVIEQPDCARRALLERDNGVCCDCGEDWSEKFLLLPEYGGRGVYHVFPDGVGRRTAHISYLQPDSNSSCGRNCEGARPYTPLKKVSLWHADHKVPLWKVEHLPDLERLSYFTLANLVTRCHQCHERKTTEEAAERAHFKRLVAPAKAKPKWASKPMQSRSSFPPKGTRPFRRR